MKLAEMVVFDHALSDDERLSVMKAMAAKWGIELAEAESGQLQYGPEELDRLAQAIAELEAKGA